MRVNERNWNITSFHYSSSNLACSIEAWNIWIRFKHMQMRRHLLVLLLLRHSFLSCKRKDNVVLEDMCKIWLHLHVSFECTNQRLNFYTQMKFIGENEVIKSKENWQNHINVKNSVFNVHNNNKKMCAKNETEGAPANERKMLRQHVILNRIRNSQLFKQITWSNPNYVICISFAAHRTSMWAVAHIHRDICIRHMLVLRTHYFVTSFDSLYSTHTGCRVR